MRKAILVVSFGTTHPDTLEKTICAVEREIQNAFPDIPCFRAFTSPTVRRRLREKQGICVDSVEEAMARIAGEGFTHVTVQPTLLLPGEEFDKLHAATLNSAGNLQVRIGRPLLWEDADLEALAQALQDGTPLPEDTILLAMGHGTAHTADSVYLRLRSAMNRRGMELCTVEGSIDFAAAREALLGQDKRKVHLVPMLLVAGEHSKNDMAGEEPDSLRSILTEAGFTVSFTLRGLGELPQVQQAFCRRVKEQEV